MSIYSLKLISLITCLESFYCDDRNDIHDDILLNSLTHDTGDYNMAPYIAPVCDTEVFNFDCRPYECAVGSVKAAIFTHRILECCPVQYDRRHIFVLILNAK